MARSITIAPQSTINIGLWLNLPIRSPWIHLNYIQIFGETFHKEQETDQVICLFMITAQHHQHWSTVQVKSFGIGVFSIMVFYTFSSQVANHYQNQKEKEVKCVVFASHRQWVKEWGLHTTPLEWVCGVGCSATASFSNQPMAFHSQRIIMIICNKCLKLTDVVCLFVVFLEAEQEDLNGNKLLEGIKN